MEVLQGLDSEASGPRPSIATLGVFDGVHRGHQEVVRRTVEWARETDAAPAVVTFDRHPAETLGRTPPAAILSTRSRLEILESLGVERVVLLAFDERLAAMSAEEFARKCLLDRLRAAGAVLGYDTRFGRGRAGDASLLSRLGLEVRIVDRVLVDGEPVKSTRVREAIQAGRIDVATRLLGRPPAIVGTVARGEGRGRGIGYPTANVQPEHDCLPPVAVYGSLVRLDGHSGPAHAAVTNVGRRPTFDPAGTPVLVESHLLDFTGDLYGRRVVVEILEPLRDERKFAGATELREQIARDIAAFRRTLEPLTG